MADFLPLQSIAILGLNNHKGELPVAPEVSEVYRERSEENAALRFLDLAALSHGYHHFSSLPKPDASFDELPELPAETQPTVSRQLAEQTVWRLSSQTLLGLALLLFKAGKVLPESWLLTALKLAATDNSLRMPVQLVLSHKARWLVDLNPQWQVLKPDDKPGRQPLALQLKQLQALDSEAAVDWILTNWSEALPETRAQWLSVLHGFPASALDAVPGLLAQERSAKTRRPLRRLLAVKNRDDTAARATGLLSEFINLSKGLLRNKLSILPPETLTPDLTALGIDDQDYLACRQVKPVLRLGQLIVLAGVEGLLACLKLPVAEGFAALAGSKFKQELAPFLLEAALWSQNPAAITAWCAHFKDEKLHCFSLANALTGIDKHTVSCLLNELSKNQIGLWADAEVYHWLTCHELSLDAACSRFVSTLEILRNNYAALIKLVGLLTPDVAQDLITTLESHDGNTRFLSEFLTVLRFRMALESADQARLP